jgi:hypothetical protein
MTSPVHDLCNPNVSPQVCGVAILEEQAFAHGQPQIVLNHHLHKVSEAGSRCPPQFGVGSGGIPS